MFNTIRIGSILVVLAALAASASAGDREDNLWITTFDHDFYNWATPHVDTFTFPPETDRFAQILLHYTIECPPAPADCDPWDRLGYLKVLHENPDTSITEYEIARIVTPYDITGGSYPGSCTWVLDVTDYRPILQDEVTLSNYIESWIGDDRGWIVTIEFELIYGNPSLEVESIENLWVGYRLVYGDPADPIDDDLQPVPVEIGPDVVAGKIRTVTTGHGQGNTHNAAEFSNKWHAVSIDGVETSHNLWRSDCNVNPCSPQGGTWPYARAGWCPGDKVDPWDVDVSTELVPGTTSWFDYEVQPYENLCRPTNPNCVNGVTCTDCNYNYNGHTEPVYALVGQLILYRINPFVFADDFESGDTGGWSTTSP